jgi:hypothetical protein
MAKHKTFTEATNVPKTQYTSVGSEMPAFYKIDKAHALVLSTAAGLFHLVSALAHEDQLLADPDFDPGYSQLLDLTHITGTEIDAESVRKMAERRVFWPCPRRAILINKNMEHSFVRMFHMLRENAGEHGIRIFRTLDDALAWIFAGQSKCLKATESASLRTNACASFTCGKRTNRARVRAWLDFSSAMFYPPIRKLTATRAGFAEPEPQS